MLPAQPSHRYAVYLDTIGTVVWVGQAVDPSTACSLATHALGEPVADFRPQPFAPVCDVLVNELVLSVYDISKFGLDASLPYVREHMTLCITEDNAVGTFVASYIRQ